MVLHPPPLSLLLRRLVRTAQNNIHGMFQSTCQYVLPSPIRHQPVLYAHHAHETHEFDLLLLSVPKFALCRLFALRR